MIIQSKPMLERTRRAYNIYRAQIEAELDSTFIMSEDSEDRRIAIKAELEAVEALTDAIDNELRAIPVSDMKKI